MRSGGRAGRRDFPKSIALLTKAAGMNHGPLFRSLLGHVYGRAGERAKAGGILDELAAMSKQRFVSPMDFAVVYAGLGDAVSPGPESERYGPRLARHNLLAEYVTTPAKNAKLTAITAS